MPRKAAPPAAPDRRPRHDHSALWALLQRCGRRSFGDPAAQALRWPLNRAEAACRDGQAPLAAVEGVVRQIIGWREYIRGVYWAQMPGYAHVNALQHALPLPDWFWTGEVRMRCWPASTLACCSAGRWGSTSTRSSGSSCRTRSA